MTLLNDTTAATVMYLHKNLVKDDKSKVLVIDVGARHCQLSLVEFGTKTIKMLCHNQAKFGGQDIDDVVLDHLADIVRVQFERDITTEPRAVWRAKQAIKKLKHDLSMVDEVTLKIQPLFDDGVDFSKGLTRSFIETLACEQFNIFRNAISSLLKEQQLDVNAISDTILAGGASRMPLIRDILINEFRLPVNQKINTEELVVCGAALHANCVVNENECFYQLWERDANIYAIKFISKEGETTPIPLKMNHVYDIHKADTDVTVVILENGHEILRERFLHSIVDENQNLVIDCIKVQEDKNRCLQPAVFYKHKVKDKTLLQTMKMSTKKKVNCVLLRLDSITEQERTEMTRTFEMLANKAL